MNIRDNKQIKILFALLVILGLTLFLGPRINRPPTASGVQTVQPKPEGQAAVANDGRIRLDLVEKDTASQQVGRQNLFQYRVAPSAAPPVRPPGASDPFAASPALSPPPQQPSRPPAPPQPPPVNLKYQGYARTDAAGAGITAFLVDDSRHYSVTTGDVLMGRYRIVGVNNTAVEVEDLQYNRRQILPLLK